MGEDKVMTRIAISHNPPTFKFEYTKGPRRSKYHKNVRMERYLNAQGQRSCMSSVERSMEIISIAEMLGERFAELRQVPAETVESMVEKLLSRYMNMLSHHESPEQSTEDTESKRVKMSIERGSLMPSPLKVSRDPLMVSKDLDLQLYRGSFSSSHAPSPGAKEGEVGREVDSSSTSHEIQADEVASFSAHDFERFGNLNRASEEELSMAKREMNDFFEKRQLLPDDDGYEYDKRVDFEPDEESSWD